VPKKKSKGKGITCPHCGRYDFLSVYREITRIEFRNINTEFGVDRTGNKPYTGNWKKERNVSSTNMILRCNACEKPIDLKKDKIEGIGEIKISSKGVMFVGNQFDKFFGEK
tara:strand:+ start:123 stop:455 length:333 start_codon:yes stop_codon:yes gene_type:complete